MPLCRVPTMYTYNKSALSLYTSTLNIAFEFNLHTVFEFKYFNRLG